MTSFRAHASADVAADAVIGAGTSIWNNAQVRGGAVIGASCVIAKGVYVDAGVVIGDYVKIQNNVSVFHGVTIEDGVFIGPHACFTNDLRPRAINSDGTLKGASDWTVTPTLVKYGAAIGANATIRCGITIGRWAMIAAGSVVTRDVPDHALVAGNPARLRGYVCACGQTIADTPERANADCPSCQAIGAQGAATGA
jgi:UDP-2-acetamido-3-amino-2,3-dideoxy-glucuronate N-acetyltransferase